MRHFRPLVEQRIADFRAANGPVAFGGKFVHELDDTLAVPDNLGARLPEVQQPQN
jgi:NADH dehydrogenase (ubiquinone) flavoprotein 1